MPWVSGPSRSFIHSLGGSMVTSTRIPPSPPSLTPSAFSPGPLLAADRSCQELPAIQQTESSTSTDVQTARSDGEEQAHADLINSAVPRVSCCLLEASMALSEKRIEDLCAQLTQAGAILDEVLTAVVPRPDPVPATEADAGMAIVPDPAMPLDLAPTPIPEEVETSPNVEIPRVMAMAA